MLSIYQWDIENTVSQDVEVLHICLGDVLRAWRLEFVHGPKSIARNQKYLHIVGSRQVVFKLLVSTTVTRLPMLESN